MMDKYESYSQDMLDDEVHDRKAAEAAAINNDGREAQLEYIRGPEVLAEIPLPTCASKPVGIVTVTDPDTQLPVEVEIRKLETGGMIGLDAAYLASLFAGENPNNPYEAGKVDVPDDEE